MIGTARVWLAGGATALATAAWLAMTGAGAATPPAPPDQSAQPSPSMPTPSAYPSPGPYAVNCAAIPIHAGGVLPADTPGDLVPLGAASVTRCDTPAATPPPPGLLEPLVLAEPGGGSNGGNRQRGAVDSFALLLNSLPAPDPGQPCLRVGFADQVSYVFVYPEPTRLRPVTVMVDRNCAALVTITDGVTTRARSYASLDPGPLFERLWAAQPSSAPGS